MGCRVVRGAVKKIDNNPRILQAFFNGFTPGRVLERGQGRCPIASIFRSCLRYNVLRRLSMSIKIDIEKKYIVNNREYASLDEMPADVREAFQKTLQAGSVMVQADTAIVFNGKAYRNIEAMPRPERELYENIMKAAANGGRPDPTALAPGLSLTINNAAGRKTSGISFSLTPVFIAVLAAAALVLYFLVF